MPGAKLTNRREGSRSEYLAQYILATLGVSVPVPYQEDIGTDFYCTLGEKDGKRTIFKGSFIVQVKSRSGNNEVRYGGLDENGKWKDAEIRWLFEQEVPLFIGVVDKDGLRMDLYSTANMWLGKYSAGHPGAVVLQPDMPQTEDGFVPRPNEKLEVDWPKGIGDGKVWSVPLGRPLISVGIDDLENNQKVAQFRKVLSWAIAMDQTNITYRRLNVHYARWPMFFRPNELEGSVRYGVGAAFNSKEGANINDQLLALAPILGTLALNYKKQGNVDGFKRIREFASILPLGSGARDELKKLVGGMFDGE